MADIKDIHLCQLEMLREVDRIAQKYDLHYVMSYGTFLGAVRHKGFIPWDDDLDISMPFDDFKKFEKIWKQELNSKYFLQTPDTDLAPFPFYKIRANNTEMVEEWLQSLNMHHGIWIDIFPYVYAAKSQLGRDLQWFFLVNLNRLRARYFNKNNKNLFRRLLASIPKWIMNILDKLLLNLITILGNKKSGLYLEMAGWEIKSPAFIQTELLDKRKKWLFEDGLFYGPDEYDKYLTKCFGKDYMIPIRYTHLSNLDNVQTNL